MDIDGGSGIPDAVPANTDETGENTTQVTFPNAGEATVPAQTDPQESPVAENSQSAQTDGRSRKVQRAKVRQKHSRLEYNMIWLL